MIYLYYSDRFSEYDFGPHHPLRPIRLTLAYRLMEDYGLLDGDDVRVIEPPLASEVDLLSVHTPDYLEAVRSERPNPSFGLGTSDNPVFEGIYDASCLVAGGSIDAARRIVEEDCSAFNFAGGLHHAMPARASGFCVFNDPALAIRVLRRRFDRVLYVDIDAHHGDGVQEIFYRDPNVLTISIHESGRYLFPGTGFVDELGGPGRLEFEGRRPGEVGRRQAQPVEAGDSKRSLARKRLNRSLGISAPLHRTPRTFAPSILLDWRTLPA